MNKHLQRIKEEDARYLASRRKGGKRTLWTIIYFCGLLLLVGALRNLIAPETQPHDTDLPNISAELAQQARDNSIDHALLPWNLSLVNRQHLLPQDFTVRLVNLSGWKIDFRIKSPLEQMIADAKKDGITLSICSAYRSVSYQSSLYEGRIKEAMRTGQSRETAVTEVQRYTHPPAASEHHTGLAIDFLTNGVSRLNEKFAESPAYAWLSEHAAQYGFIQRYPKGFEEQTGIYWEPWHYRYVGADHAAAISSRNITLEEYCTEQVNLLKEAQ